MVANFSALYESQMEIYRFDVASGKLLRVIKLADVADEEGAMRFSLSDDGRWLCMTEVYGHISVWNAANGKTSIPQGDIFAPMNVKYRRMTC